MHKDKNEKKITSSSNPIIKEIKGLYRKKERWKQKKFIIEGVKIVEECLNKKYLIDYVVYSNKLYDVAEGKKLLNKIEKYNIDIVHIPNNLFNEISDIKNPQGIMAIVKINLISLDDIINDENFLVLLDEVMDPGNMGTIIRTADAFGATGIILTDGSVDVYNPKVVRSSMGSIFHIPLCYVEDKLLAFKTFKEKNIAILATSLEGKKFIQDVDFKKDFVFIIGNEARGISQESINYADELVKIYMPGKAESLNAAIAASIIMYEAAIDRSNESCFL